MPIYEYRCENGHTFEVIQSMSDGPATECEVCGAPVERVFNPVAVHFKGSGFYNTDYKNKGKGAATAPAKDSKESKDSGKSSSSDSGDSGSKSDSKSSDSKKSDSTTKTSSPSSD